ncbi:hypothetical protein GTP41_01825 [Pseudoduganella sp. DS3]|uniref:Uncharacterized protein n=1 Tax=Pseudoduganella guangdongensis TaxID=2692179 RepID=A0A6N9HBI1_9BURK|nr:DUF6572 domain-containing protein [Pseudoduganella guangdongensis]MYN00829.1 hypothetical protein [Pseudoduganella guangdongensis]
MGLDNCDIVDAVGTDISTGKIVLSVLDSWDWTDESEHLKTLQAKLNAYFSFVDSRQIYEAYPNAEGKGLVVDIVTKFPIPESGMKLLEKAAVVASSVGLELTHRHLA